MYNGIDNKLENNGGIRMSSLNSIDKIPFEKLFDMSNGYVLNFNNGSFRAFVIESTGIDIYDSSYKAAPSKAKKLRLFLDKENDYTVHKLLSDLLLHWHVRKETYDQEINNDDLQTYEKCKNILMKLKDNSVFEEIENISTMTNNNSQDINLLTTEIKDKLQEGNPQLALDRLHTFSVRFFRELCKKHNLQFKKDAPLHTLMGIYWRLLENENKFSEMTLQILKSNINTMNTFNNIRNNKSFAHDNDILNKSESKLICNHVITLLKFIDEIEEQEIIKNTF